MAGAICERKTTTAIVNQRAATFELPSNAIKSTSAVGIVNTGQRDPKLIIEKAALRHFVQPADVGEAIWFLCSDAAGAITGVTLPIDAGWLATSAYTAYAAVPA